MSDSLSTSSSLEDRLSHTCFPQPENSSVKVWRYMDFAKFIWLLKEKKLFLSRVDKLGDPYEGSHTIKTIQGIEEFLHRHKAKEGWGHLAEIYRQARAETYVCCWHEGEYESEAMWRLYSPNGNGVAIQLTYQELVHSIENQHEIFIGRIRYIDYSREWFPDANIYHPIMHKRIAFSHEREVRMVCRSGGQRYEPMPENGTLPFTSVPWDPARWVHKIYVDPYAPKYFFEAVDAVIDSMMPGIRSRLVWSQMRELPIF